MWLHLLCKCSGVIKAKCMRFSLECANAFVCAIDGIRYVCRYLNDASDVILPNNVLLMPAYANPNEYCTILH